jgi:hypothetical protein
MGLSHSPSQTPLHPPEVTVYPYTKKTEVATSIYAMAVVGALVVLGGMSYCAVHYWNGLAVCSDCFDLAAADEIDWPVDPEASS